MQKNIRQENASSTMKGNDTDERKQYLAAIVSLSRVGVCKAYQDLSSHMATIQLC